MRDAFDLLRQAYKEWNEDKASRLAAALAYYAIFATAPLLVMLVLIIGLAFGAEAAQGEVVSRLEGVVGAESARLLQQMIDNAAERTSGGIVATLFGFAALVLGATGLFTSLEDALNTVWEVEPERGGGVAGAVKRRVFDRLWAFALMVGVGLLMIAALVASTALNVLVSNFAGAIPGFPLLWYAGNIVLSLLLLTVLVAAVFKVLPQADIAWKDVWIGSAFTSMLFVIGKELLSLYLGRASVGSVYGAAGSLVVLLIWIYYSAQILLFGAEFTQVYAKRYGSRVKPAKNAVGMTEERRAQMGVPHDVAVEEAQRLEEARREEELDGRGSPGLLWGLAERYASVVVGLAFGWLIATLGFPRGRR